MEENENQELTYMKLFEVKRIQDKLDNIQTQFFLKKLGAGTQLMNKTFSSATAKSRAKINTNIVNSNKMEPMSKEPYTKTENLQRLVKDREI